MGHPFGWGWGRGTRIAADRLFGFAQGRFFGDDNQNGNGKCDGLVAGGRFTSHPSR
jgi:hypothetical protein